MKDTKIILFRFTNEEDLNNFKFKINNSVEFSEKITENHKDIIKDLTMLKDNINCDYIILKQLVLEKDSYISSIIPIYMANMVYVIIDNNIFISKYQDRELSNNILNEILINNTHINIKKSIDSRKILALKHHILNPGIEKFELDKDEVMYIKLNILEQQMYDNIINKIKVKKIK